MSFSDVWESEANTDASNYDENATRLEDLTLISETTKSKEVKASNMILAGHRIDSIRQFLCEQNTLIFV